MEGAGMMTLMRGWSARGACAESTRASVQKMYDVSGLNDSDSNIDMATFSESRKSGGKVLHESVT